MPRKIPSTVCTKDTIYNPKTKRCIQNTPQNKKRIETRKPYIQNGKLYNPYTNRYIIDNLANRRKLNYPLELAPCPSGKIRNPKTLRCIKDTTVNRNKIKQLMPYNRSNSPEY